MTLPFEFDDAWHLQTPAQSVNHDPQDVKREEAIQSFVVVLLIIAVFAGALYFILTRQATNPLSPKVRSERWKDWRPLDG
jgi:hypothetical protein